VISRERFNIAIYLAVLVMLLDQMSKWWLVHEIAPPPGGLAVIPFFNLVLVENRGATFGLLSRFDPNITFYFFTVTAAIILLFLGPWLWRTSSTLVAFGIGFIMGGAVGNVIDRIRFGAVIDFLDFYVNFQGQAHHWPAFNLADSAIVTGVALLLLDSIVRKR